jgi:class 3 adenylate cyclase/tetratricopeptide (TPR) repeat protein
VRIPNPAFAMSFLETIRRAKAYLEEQGRVSRGALQREFELDDEALNELVDELVDIQQVAAREGKAIAWTAGTLQAGAPERVIGSPTHAGTLSAQAERRQLTVLFCDLVDSTALSSRLDAEALREVLRAYQDGASEVIGRYEGHIAQYLGDGLLVYFGYPQAHEDDAERAVRAGHEIPLALGRVNDRLERESGVRLGVRIGIHTGPVVVGEMGDGDRRETLAVGETTNIAARLQNMAEPDAVLISDATHRLVPGLFVTQDLGTPVLKGVAEPIRVHRVLQQSGIRSRLKAASSLTPLVGREQELGLLLDRWRQVIEGDGQAVVLSGEAGVGKSRLLHGLRESLADTSHTWLECQASPYARDSAFQPIIELVQQACGFKETDAWELKLGRLEAGLELAGLSTAELVPLLAPLLAIPHPDSYRRPALGPELQRKETIGALAAWTLALGQRQPVVMVVEDLHWCDPSTLEVVGRLLEQIPRARVLILLSFRPEFEPPWPARSHVTPVAVGRLQHHTASQMIAAIAGDRALPDPVVERILERAGGMALYVEELTKSVLESGMLSQREDRYELTGDLEELAIPTTLQDSLMARLDRLSAAKQVAQLAATLGREFSYEFIAAVAELDDDALRQGLARLVEAELVYQRGAPPAAIYSFKHALIEETAYRSLLRSVRQPLHKRIARILEQQFPGRAKAEPELLARHYERADLPVPAAASYGRAADLAFERSAIEESTRLFKRGLDLLVNLPEGPDRQPQELELQLGLSKNLLATKGFAHDDVASAYARAYELCHSLDDTRLRAHALAGRSIVHNNRAELDSAVRVAREIFALGQEVGDEAIAIAGDTLLGIPLGLQGHPADALRRLDRVISYRGPLPSRDLGSIVEVNVAANSFSALSVAELGRLDTALERARRGVELARELDQPFEVASALTLFAFCRYMRREVDQVLELAEEILAIAERQSFIFFVGSGKMLRGSALAISSSEPASIGEYWEGVSLLAATGSRSFGPAFLGLGGEAHAAAGQPDMALQAIEMGLQTAEKNGERFWEPELHRAKGELLIAAEDSEETRAESLFERALEIAQNQGARLHELRAATSLARCWQRQSKHDEARDLLAPIYNQFTEGFDTQVLKDAKALLAPQLLTGSQVDR